MRISVDELRKATLLLLDHLATTGQTSFQVDEDFYWHVPESQRYDSYSEPRRLTVGQLSDDWSELQKIADGQRAPTGTALVWLASILRRIGEKSEG